MNSPTAKLSRNTGADGDGFVRDLREDSDIRDARYGAGRTKFFEMKLIQVGAAKAVFAVRLIVLGSF
jgi:hypothetical protein